MSAEVLADVSRGIANINGDVNRCQRMSAEVSRTSAEMSANISGCQRTLADVSGGIADITRCHKVSPGQGIRTICGYMELSALK